MEPTMEAGVEPAGEARAPFGPVVKIDGLLAAVGIVGLDEAVGEVQRLRFSKPLQAARHGSILVRPRSYRNARSSQRARLTGHRFDSLIGFLHGS